MNNKQSASAKTNKNGTYNVVIETLAWFQLLHCYIKLRNNNKLKIKIAQKLRSHPKQTWRNISKTKNLSGSFLNEFRFQLDWNVVSKHLMVTKSILYQFQNFLNLDILSQRYKIPEGIIKTQFNNINLKQLCKRQQLSENTLTFLLSLDNERVATEHFNHIKFKDYLNLVLWPEICTFQKINERIITFIYEFRIKNLSKTLKTHFWKIILQNKNLNPGIIDRFFKSKKVLKIDFEQ